MYQVSCDKTFSCVVQYFIISTKIIHKKQICVTLVDDIVN